MKSIDEINNRKKIFYEKLMELFQKLEALQEMYAKSDVNNEDIIQLESSIRVLRETINNLNKLLMNYNSSSYSNDTIYLLDLIVALANKDSDDYILKKYYATSIPLKNESIDKEELYGIIYVISRKSILDDISNKKIYVSDGFSSVAHDILKSHNSMVTVTENGYGIIIEPKFKSQDLKTFDIIGSDNTSNINFYLYDDALGNAVRKVTDYIKKNKNDLSKYSIEDIIEKIDNYDNKVQTK